MDTKPKPSSARAAGSLSIYKHDLPSPIPTAKGSRSSALPLFCHHLDRSIRIPQLKLPSRPHRTCNLTINPNHFSPRPSSIQFHYPSIALRDKDTVDRLLESLRSGGFGAFQITAHGISTHDLRFSSFFDRCGKIFESVQCCRCTNYGDQEEVLYDEMTEKLAASVIGGQNSQIFRQKLDNVARQLEAIAQELVKAIVVESGIKYNEGEARHPVEAEEATLSICRYNPTSSITRVKNPTPRNHSCGSQDSRMSDPPYALSLHLLVDSSEFCLEHEEGYSLAFSASPDTLVVTVGKEIEEWSRGELKSGQGKTTLKRGLVQANFSNDKPSYAIQQKWRWRKIGGNKTLHRNRITLIDQVSAILIASLVYKLLLIAHSVYSQVSI